MQVLYELRLLLRVIRKNELFKLLLYLMLLIKLVLEINQYLFFDMNQ
jgi:hypothetical protein